MFLSLAFALALTEPATVAPAADAPPGAQTEKQPETLLGDRKIEHSRERLEYEMERALERVREAGQRAIDQLERAERRYTHDEKVVRERERKEDAEQETLFPSSTRRMGGLVVEQTIVRERPAITLGGLTRRQFAGFLGITDGAKLLLPTVPAPGSFRGGNTRGNEKIWMLTWNAAVQWIPLHRRAVHPVSELGFGLGGAGVVDFDRGDRFFATRPDFVYSVEPSLGIEFNVVQEFQFDVAAFYRDVHGLEAGHLAPAALDSFGGRIVFLFAD